MVLVDQGGSVVVAELCGPDEVEPVALAERVHVEGVLALDLVGLPVAGQDVVPRRPQELLGGQVGHPVLVLCVGSVLPSGSMIFLMSKWCLQRLPTLLATTFSPRLILCPSRFTKNRQWARWQGGMAPNRSRSLKYLQKRWAVRRYSHEKSSTTSSTSLSLSYTCCSTSPIAQVAYSGLATPALRMSSTDLGSLATSVMRHLGRVSNSTSTRSWQRLVMSSKWVCLSLQQMLGTGSYSSSRVPVRSILPYIDRLTDMSLRRCSLVVRNSSSHSAACWSLTNSPLNIFLGSAFSSCVHFSTLGTLTTTQLCLKANIAAQARIIDRPVPASPPRNTLLQEGVSQLNRAEYGICLRMGSGGLVSNSLKRLVKSLAEGSTSCAITQSKAWSAIANTSSSWSMLWRMELTRVSLMTELPHTRRYFSESLSCRALAYMQLDSSWNRAGQFFSSSTNSRRSSGGRAMRAGQSTGAASCRARMALARPMDSLRTIMANFSLTSYSFWKGPKGLEGKTVWKSWLLNMMQEPTSQQVCSSMVLRVVGSTKVISSSADMSGGCLQLLISSSSQKRSRYSRRRQALTSSFRMRGLSSLERLRFSSWISTVYSILGRTEVMYCLKESTGWYFFWTLPRGTDLPASLFLTTSSTKLDRIGDYYQSQSYHPTTHSPPTPPIIIAAAGPINNAEGHVGLAHPLGVRTPRLERTARPEEHRQVQNHQEEGGLHRQPRSRNCPLGHCPREAAGPAQTPAVGDSAAGADAHRADEGGAEGRGADRVDHDRGEGDRDQDAQPLHHLPHQEDAGEAHPQAAPGQAQHRKRGPDSQAKEFVQQLPEGDQRAQPPRTGQKGGELSQERDHSQVAAASEQAIGCKYEHEHGLEGGFSETSVREELPD